MFLGCVLLLFHDFMCFRSGTLSNHQLLFCTEFGVQQTIVEPRDHSGYGLSQWEPTLQCNQIMTLATYAYLRNPIEPSAILPIVPKVNTNHHMLSYLLYAAHPQWNSQTNFLSKRLSATRLGVFIYVYCQSVFLNEKVLWHTWQLTPQSEFKTCQIN